METLVSAATKQWMLPVPSLSCHKDLMGAEEVEALGGELVAQCTGPGAQLCTCGAADSQLMPSRLHPRSHHQSGFSVLRAEPACLPTCTQGCRDLQTHTASLPVEREHRPSSGTSLGTVSVPVTPSSSRGSPASTCGSHAGPREAAQHRSKEQ